MLLWILRSVLSFVLGLLVFGAFLVYVVFSALNGLFDDRVYADALVEADAYQRLYSQAYAIAWEDFGEIPGVSYADLVAMVREVAPPAYLQEQVEDNLERMAAYFGKGKEPDAETDRLELYLELEQPLARLKPTILDYLDRRVDGLEVLEPESPYNPFEQVGYVQDLNESLYVLLQNRETPGAVPSIRFIPDLLRPVTFDLVMGQAPDYLSLDSRSRRKLESGTPKLREQFIAGNTREFIKLVTRAIAIPYIDEAIAEIEAGLGLDDRRRLDLLAVAADGMGYASEAELQRELAGLRSGLRRTLNQGRVWSLIAVIVGTAAMGLLYLRQPATFLRWLRLTLLLTSVGAFALGWLAQMVLPGLLGNQVGRLLSSNFGLSPESINLASDVTESVIVNLLDGITWPALIPLLLAVALFAAPYGWARWQKLRGQSSAPEPSSGPGAA